MSGFKGFNSLCRSCQHCCTLLNNYPTTSVHCYVSKCSLAYMDSHHKLIRWRIITHAAIDGFSCTILYAVCTNNNKATTLLSCFLDGVSVYGLPQGVRSDHGGENIEVWKYMIIAHGGDISCVLTGSSMHNERIERLWRDVHRSVTTTYMLTYFVPLKMTVCLTHLMRWIYIVCISSIFHEYGNV